MALHMAKDRLHAPARHADFNVRRVNRLRAAPRAYTPQVYARSVPDDRNMEGNVVTNSTIFRARRELDRKTKAQA